MKKDKATDAYDAGDYETALKEFRKLAEKGDAEAQNNLGVMYAKGEGVTQNNKEAAKWYHLAAEQGHASAQYNLGVMCYTTKYHGTTIRDKKEGAKWYHLAAEQGHAGAQYRLGLMYRDEFGDDESTLKLLRLAAKQGYEDAQYDLALMYRDGDGVTQNHNESHKWFYLREEKHRLAAERGDANAANYLGIMYANGKFDYIAFRGLSPSDNPLEFTEDEDFTSIWSEDEDFSENEDCITAVEWFRLAAEWGHGGACYNLYRCYRDGLGVKQDKEKADYWYAKAEENDGVP